MNAHDPDNIYELLNNGDSHQHIENEGPNDRTFLGRIRRSIVQQVNKWTIKEIILGLIMVCLTLLVIILSTRLIYCKQEMPVAESNVYPISTTTSIELVRDFDETIEMKIMKNIKHSFDMNVRPFHPFNYVLLSTGDYLIKFDMSVFRHVKHLNNDSSTYGVTMTLDERTLVICLPGQVGNLSLHETEPCSFLPAPDRKYLIDLDKEYTFVQSLISFNLDVKVESDNAKLKLLFAQEGFIDDSTLLIAKKS